MVADFLDRVTRADSCTGCGLCAAVSPGIRMAAAGPGWARPEQTGAVSAAEDAAIAAACPGLVVDQRDNPHDPAEPLWGPQRFTGVGHATDAAMRYRASSGGMISALLAHALASGLVDFVVQVRADPDQPTGNITSISTSSGDIMMAAGSRYARSSPLAGLNDWLARPGRFAFVGKPCDVAALRARAKADPALAARVPLMLAFFCAGIPSDRAVNRILDRLEVKPADVATFRFRGDGWPGFATATLADGSTKRMTYNDSWGQILSKEIQFRCKICADAVGAAADVACADAWYGDDRGYPSFEETDGRSLVMARTAAGLAVLDSARAAGAVATQPVPVADIIRMQPHQARRKRQVLSRLWAMRVAGRPVPRYLGLGVSEAARREPVMAQVKSFAGLVRRFIKGTA
jgi:coenzyme F420 hydrogenase subunit beta